MGAVLEGRERERAAHPAAGLWRTAGGWERRRGGVRGAAQMLTVDHGEGRTPEAQDTLPQTRHLAC